MSEKFILLTETDYNNLLKLKQQHESRNEYHKNYIKSMFQDAKINDHEKYKILMHKQNEKNKKYKKEVLQRLKKQEPEKYNDYRCKINEYNKQYRLKKKENLINSIVAI